MVPTLTFSFFTFTSQKGSHFTFTDKHPQFHIVIHDHLCGIPSEWSSGINNSDKTG